MSEIFVVEAYAVALLVIATLVGILARRVRIPYTLGLVAAGTALAVLYQQFRIEIEPDLILGNSVGLGRSRKLIPTKLLFLTSKDLDSQEKND